MDTHKAGAGGGAGEVRRLNVVYFLSRGGRTDHPHLFRVNQHSRAGGVRLRDVKRWLSEIRGKDMPDNFSWSYKRKYKGGYVWQDLKDDDLITPISDNEYVLKGCDVRGTPPRCVQAPKTTPSSFSLDEKTRDDDKDEKTTCGDRADRAVEVVLTPDSDESSPKPPPADDQDSPGSGGESAARRSTSVLFKIEVSHSSSTQDLQGQNRHRQQEQRKEEPEAKAVSTRAVARPAPGEQLRGAARGGHAVTGGNKPRTMRVARALHNILTCGAADADDAALRPVVARRQRREAGGDDDWLPPPPTTTCPGIGTDGCGLRVSRKARLRKGGKEKQGKRDGGKRDGPGGAHKPAALPRCSQCGKEFKPQELHSHMQSCRGLKERMRSGSTSSGRVSVDRSRQFAARAAEHRSRPGRCTPERPAPASAVFLLTES